MQTQSCSACRSGLACAVSLLGEALRCPQMNQPASAQHPRADAAIPVEPQVLFPENPTALRATAGDLRPRSLIDPQPEPPKPRSRYIRKPYTFQFRVKNDPNSAIICPNPAQRGNHVYSRRDGECEACGIPMPNSVCLNKRNGELRERHSFRIVGPCVFCGKNRFSCMDKIPE